MIEVQGFTSDSAPEGRMADNIVHFARALRKAGMRVGPASVVDAIDAVTAVCIGLREDFYWTLHAVLVKRKEDRPLFDEAFRLFWKSRDLGEGMLPMPSPVASAKMPARQRAAQSRAASAVALAATYRREMADASEIDLDARTAFSGDEVLRRKDFAQMSADELAAARKAIAALRLPADLVRTRRFRAGRQGTRLDLRAIMHASLRTGGELILPRFRTPREMHPPLVVLADISGSMSGYTRIFLHFMHSLAEQRRRVHSFVFGTRLTNLTRQVRHRDPDEALAASSLAVRDWSGGTRIGDALRDFNRLWSRRVLWQGAVVLLITDGLEREEADRLSIEMERLHKSCRRLIWLNPLLRFDGFEPRARGVRAMLPHVDEFRPVHSLDALTDLVVALSDDTKARRISVGRPVWRVHTKMQEAKP